MFKKDSHFAFYFLVFEQERFGSILYASHLPKYALSLFKNKPRALLGVERKKKNLNIQMLVLSICQYTMINDSDVA